MVTITSTCSIVAFSHFFPLYVPCLSHVITSFGPVAPSVAMPGPNPGTSSNAGMGATQTAVAPSPTYVGPSPGAGNGNMPPRFEKAADWDANTALHPYTSNMGPRPN